MVEEEEEQELTAGGGVYEHRVYLLEAPRFSEDLVHLIF